ncbi:integrase catalytic region [Bacillus thuringiensis Sbt003]|uniref:DDE domain-containing protein n=2 Tax=Bacillus cereus group TaxID=86661 RepID=A0A9W5KQZ8_BACCE|nr:hypothetical protein IK5_06122 [Bacillus cereus VD154]KIU73037.1 integrase catalytic region [Bacillus thuringiensis Sbt003]
MIKATIFSGNDGRTKMLSGLNDYYAVDSIRVEQKNSNTFKQTNDSRKVDETYIKFSKKDMYLYQAIASDGNTIDFHLNKKEILKLPKLLSNSSGFLS